MPMLTLYIDDHWVSPYAFSSFVALREKKLDFEIEEVSLPKREQYAPAYRGSSLTGRAPSLRHDDYWLSESSAIHAYLAEACPFPQHPRIFPEGLKERGRARQLMAWVRSDLMPIREQRGTASVFYDRPVQPLNKEGEESVARLLRVAVAIHPHGPTTPLPHMRLADPHRP